MTSTMIDTSVLVHDGGEAFGVNDSKGREIGACTAIYRVTFRPSDSPFGYSFPPGSVRFNLRRQPTRDSRDHGRCFDSWHETMHEAEVAADTYLRAARARHLSTEGC